MPSRLYVTLPLMTMMFVALGGCLSIHKSGSSRAPEASGQASGAPIENRSYVTIHCRYQTADSTPATVAVYLDEPKGSPLLRVNSSSESNVEITSNFLRMGRRSAGYHRVVFLVEDGDDSGPMSLQLDLTQPLHNSSDRTGFQSARRGISDQAVIASRTYSSLVHGFSEMIEIYLPDDFTR
jgi:hypothetical protein